MFGEPDEPMSLKAWLATCGAPRKIGGVFLARNWNEIQRLLLGGLLTFVGLNALGGGVFGVVGAKGVPTEWLRGTPFESYFLPSLILLLVVGGSALVAALAVLWRHPLARKAAWSAGVILIGWMAVQLAIIGYVSWLQPTFVAAAVLVLTLAAALPGGH